jgi:hypothetical protein
MPVFVRLAEIGFSLFTDLGEISSMGCLLVGLIDDDWVTKLRIMVPTH